MIALARENVEVHLHALQTMTEQYCVGFEVLTAATMTSKYSGM
jgi:hypothetical protein